MKTKYMALLICAALLMAPAKTALAAQEQTTQPVWTLPPQTSSAPAATPEGAAEESLSLIHIWLCWRCPRPDACARSCRAGRLSS